MELKTKVSDASVIEHLDALENETRRADCQTLCRLMQDATGAEAKLWGSNIIGFGSYRSQFGWPEAAFVAAGSIALPF
ncbi:hypothetical protein [Armatimonas sp.]|uniref:hypothetical protein n=1 Tax=Armatimonas sp. TaxID=1872638 RepID=UPI0037507269